MDSVDKRIKETIESTCDQDLYSIGDAQVLSDEAQEKAYRLQKGTDSEIRAGIENTKKTGTPKETSPKGDYWY